MNPYAQLILIASLTVIVAAPILFGAIGVWRSRSVASAAAASGPWRWQRTLHSSLLYALSFSLIFFIQELFLVVPKALTPGLRATLYHNNHNWTGDNPLAHLFQGTGALAILLTALGFVAWLKLRPPRTETARLFAIWMAFHGFFQSLPQVVVGAVLPQNDVGMAFGYLQWADTTKLERLQDARTAQQSIRQAAPPLRHGAGRRRKVRLWGRWRWRAARRPARRVRRRARPGDRSCPPRLRRSPPSPR